MWFHEDDQSQISSNKNNHQNDHESWADFIHSNCDPAKAYIFAALVKLDPEKSIKNIFWITVSKSDQGNWWKGQSTSGFGQKCQWKWF